MRVIILAALLFFVGAQTVLAQTPEPGSPYDFQPYDFEADNGVDLSDDLGVFSSPEFINQLGSTTVTIFAMMDALDFLAIFVVLLLGLATLWWVYRNVTGGKAAVAQAFNDNPFRSATSRRRRR